MALFALSCIGLLIFLWVSFGGTLPFVARGYEFRVSFPFADQLGTQADVRIAGVSVGKVIGKSLDPDGNRTIATIQLDNQYAPIRANAHAILRTKTILGETYVALTPGTRSAPILRDGALLTRANVTPAVQLDQIYNEFDPSTRHAFQQWQQEIAQTLKGNDQNLNSVLGNLPSFAADATDVLQVLDVQHNAVVNLVRGGGTVFAALNQNQQALQNLITTGETTFHTTAVNQNALAHTFRNFPQFLAQTKETMAQLQTFSVNTDPVLRALHPVAVDLGPTLHSVKVLSPDLRRLFTNLGPLITVSKTGLPALSGVLNGATPLLGALGPWLEQLNPIIDWLGLHQQLLSDFISNGAASLAAKTTVFGGSGSGHYLRQFSPEGAETLSIYTNRDSGNRGDTYPPSLWLGDPKFLQTNIFGSFDCSNTGAAGNGTTTALTIPEIGHPACWVQPTLPGAKPGQIPHITAASYSSK
ncbi:MAG TPA: MlaD family protein [Solirubrobacteraceae bacterium]|nr:MlaD family protein [Solirubrobacteraceae bacterium]